MKQGGQIPANKKRRPNVRLMLAHRLRHWANINLTLGRRIVFAGMDIETPVCMERNTDMWLEDIRKHQDKHVFSVHKRQN